MDWLWQLGVLICHWEEEPCLCTRVRVRHHQLHTPQRISYLQFKSCRNAGALRIPNGVGPPQSAAQTTILHTNSTLYAASMQNPCQYKSMWGSRHQQHALQ